MAPLRTSLEGHVEGSVEGSVGGRLGGIEGGRLEGRVEGRVEGIRLPSHVERAVVHVAEAALVAACHLALGAEGSDLVSNLVEAQFF